MLESREQCVPAGAEVSIGTTYARRKLTLGTTVVCLEDPCDQTSDDLTNSPPDTQKREQVLVFTGNELDE